LFLQVQFPLSLATVKYLHFLLLGWGLPGLNMAAWVALCLAQPGPAPTAAAADPREVALQALQACPFLFMREETSLLYVDLYGYKVPVFFLLAANVFFLVWIMVVAARLRAGQEERRHWRAARALLVVLPLLGTTYLLTLYLPAPAHPALQLLRAALLASQGALTTLPYCYFNTEVQTAVRLHWARWRLVRSVGRPGTATPCTTLALTPLPEQIADCLLPAPAPATPHLAPRAFQPAVLSHASS